MKINKTYYPMVLALVIFEGNLPCFAAQFSNLNFEAAVATTGSVPPSTYIPASVAIPGWSALIDNTSSLVLFNDGTLGSSTIALWKLGFGNPSGPNPVLSGQFSVVLISGFTDLGDGGPLQPTSASISQLGLVPGSAASVRFIALGDEPQVLANGTLLPVFSLGTTPGYTLYGADVSAYAGNEIELRFRRPHTANFTGSILDDITFSTEPVPEPSVIALLALAGAGLFWHLRRRK